MQTWGKGLFVKNKDLCLYYSTLIFLQMEANFYIVRNESPWIPCECMFVQSYINFNIRVWGSSIGMDYSYTDGGLFPL